MGVISTQGIKFQLVANSVILDLFKDEDIKLSDNVTGLFDLGVIPADFTRQLTLPGSKKNNAFFEHVYDISVQNPDTFSTNIKVPAYIDFNGIYLAQGYLQLNKVNIYQNKFIDSYEVSIYGAISSFAREINRSFLTDLTSLNAYNHTSSINTITGSWENKLFSGSIVYPLAEYGQRIEYNPESLGYGIDSENDGLCVQDFKPAIKAKIVWDAIFSEAGYTYSSSFINGGGLDGIYLICNRALRYPIYNETDLETFGLFKIAPISGSGQTNWQPTAGSQVAFPWYNIQKNPAGNLAGDLKYSLPYSSSLRGNANFNVKISGSANAGGLGKVPQFELQIYNTGTSTYYTISLDDMNNYFTSLQAYNGTQGTKQQTVEIAQKWISPVLPSGSYYFDLRWTKSSDGNGDVVITFDPDNNIKSYLEVTKVAQLGDGWVMDIPLNMPYATRGIKQIDFLTSVQKKFNLVMYPSKTVRNEIIVEPFTRWYNKGRRWDFNKYANLNDKMEVIPANNFAVNELGFSDTLDQDYISLQFSKGANREYGKTYFVDTENFFSQGKFEVKTAVSSTPLVQIANTGVSGSVSGLNPGGGNIVFQMPGSYRPNGTSNYSAACSNYNPTTLYSSTGVLEPSAVLYYDSEGKQPLTGIRTLIDENCAIWDINPINGVVINDSGESCTTYNGYCL